jgi:hypothetical protein
MLGHLFLIEQFDRGLASTDRPIGRKESFGISRRWPHYVQCSKVSLSHITSS